MTTLAVQRIDDTRLILCADRRASPADNLSFDGVSKVLVLESGEHVAVSGPLVALQAFHCYVEENEVDFSSQIATYRTMLAFRQDLHVNQLCLTDKGGEGDFAVFPMEMLIVNAEGKIFTVYNYGEVVEHPQFTALGSGAAYALGALGAEATIDAAMTVAAMFDTGTSPEYETYEINIETEFKTGTEDDVEEDAAA